MVASWRAFVSGLRALVWRSTLDRELEAELNHFEQEAVDELRDRGLAAEDAVRLARLEVGSRLVVRERVQDAAWERHVEALFGDIRYAVRQLRGRPAFAVASLITLALGIGASATIFSAVNPLLFMPLPYPHAERIVSISDFTRDGGRLDVTFGTYRELQARSRSFETLAVFRPWRPTLTGAAEAERADGQRVTADFFRVLGVAPVLGRDFNASDDIARGPRVVILSHTLWMRRFAADPSIVGRDIALDDLPHTVIGVMPPSFENVVAPTASVWAPLQYDIALPVDGREWGHHLQLIGRLASSASLDRASEELQAIARMPIGEFPRVPWASLASGLHVARLQHEVTRAVRPALLAVMAAVLLLLAMACVNVANLTVARGLRRRAEFAMRTALGASRGRVARQVIVESLVLAAAGGLGGTLLAVFAVRWLVLLLPAGLPRATAMSVSLETVVFSCVATTLVGTAIGLAQLRAMAADVQPSLRTGVREAGGHRRATHALIVCEIAFALVLVVSAGLLTRSLQNFFAVSPGFNPEHLLVLQVQVTGAMSNDQAAHRFFHAALQAVSDIPGVAHAGFVNQLPLSGDREEYGARFVDEGEAGRDAGIPVFRYAVSAGYAGALGLPVRAGRGFGGTDLTGRPVAMISETLARRLPGDDVIGQRLIVGPANREPFTVIGVVGDVRQASLADPSADAVYMPAEHWAFADRVRWLVLRTHGDPLALAAAARTAVAAVDRNQPIVRVATMEQLLAQSAVDRRFAMILFQLFGLAGLLLVATGLYGVLANAVSERTREIGVRVALGASRGGIVRLVGAQSLTLLGLGMAVGLPAAAAASGALTALLFGLSPLDPTTYAGVAGLVALIATVSCALPAWRATRVDPAITLRAE